MNLMNLRKAIMDEENITLEEMQQIFNVTKEELFESIKELLKDSDNDTKLKERLEQRKDIIYGKIHINRDCRGIVNFGDTKYHINTEDVYDALNEDMVIIEPVEEGKTRARVKAVVKREDGLFIANYVDGELIPFNNPINTKIVLNDEDKEKIKNEDRVQLCIDKTVGDTTYCHLNQIVGHKDDLVLGEKTILLENKFHAYFNKGCKDEEAELPKYVTSRMRQGRLDLRGYNSFTIDAPDTQDIDDGLFAFELPNGNIRYGVPVSHVSKLVKRGGFIFQEAAERGTSVYEGGHSEPMFPRSIANGIGALKEGEDRLARTLIVDFDPDLEIINYKIAQSVIRSRKKMTYEAVDDVLLKDRIPNGYDPFIKNLRLVERITDHLEKRKLDRGALDIIGQDIKPIFDYLYRVVGFEPLGNPHSRKIIENSALLYNELYDMDCAKNGIININRVETAPSIEKMNSAIKLINNTGYNIPELGTISSQEVNRLLRLLKDDPRLPVYSSLVLQALQKAGYSIKDLGHFGLALKFYAQFTSPIRRHPDFINHCIQDDFDAGLPPQFTRAQLETYAKHDSIMELRSDNATYETYKMYAAELAIKEIGESKKGRIISLNPSGLLVKTDDNLVGKVNLKDILSGKYTYVKETNSFVGKDKIDTYHLADRVEILIKDANKEKRTVDFSLVEKEKEKELVKILKR